METGEMKKKIWSFQDLYVYQNLYSAMKDTLVKIVPALPKEEKFDLASQMRRACKAPLAIIAEGYAKRHQKKNWFKYIDDAIGECNEMISHLSICKDIYSGYVDVNLCENLIKIYNITGKQLYMLGKNWKSA